MSVSEAQSRIDSAEFAEWIAYNNTDPFTVNRIENMLGVVAAILVNTNMKRGGRMYDAKDFIPKYSKQKKQNGRDLETKMRAIFNGNN